MPKKIRCAFLWVGIAALPYGLHAMEPSPEEVADRRAHPPRKLLLGEPEVREYLFGQDVSWPQYPATPEEIACNQHVVTRITEMAARGVRFILLCGLNRENQREGAYLSPTSNVTVVTLSYDGRPSAAVMQRILNNEILHLSGSWTDSIFMGPIPSVFQVILFCAGAAQYPNALALQSLASKLHPKGCLYIQLQSFTQREEGDITIKDPGLEFVYEQDGFRHYAVCYTPPWTLHEALPEGQFGMSVTMACHDPFWKNLTPWENAYAEFLRSRCREHGITFVLCLWRTMGVLFHQYRPKTFSSTIYNTINQSRPEGILQFDKTPIATIWRGSPENPPEDD